MDELIIDAVSNTVRFATSTGPLIPDTCVSEELVDHIVQQAVDLIGVNGLRCLTQGLPNNVLPYRLVGLFLSEGDRIL
jgi:hypothetical protein